MTLIMEFHQAMLDGCQRSAEIGYTPNYFRRQIANEGGVATVKSLLFKSGVSEGFIRLWREGRLDLSCEAYVVAPYYAELFTPSERQQARERLELFDFDVEGHLVRVGDGAP